MSDAARQSLWDLTPGVVHQLANVLFTVQGRALLLPDGADKQAIADGAQRAQQAVQVLRWLLGEGLEAPVPAGAVVQRVGELLRTGLRDAGVRLDVTVATARTAVDPIACSRCLAACVRALAPAVAGGGTLQIECVDDGAAVELRAVLVPAPGALRFPLAVTDLRARLADELGALAAELALAPALPGGVGAVVVRWTPVAAGLARALAKS